MSYGLLKLLRLNDGRSPTMEILREEKPTLEEFTAEIKKRGGGLKNTLAYVRDSLGEEKFNRFRSLHKPEVAKKIFMEHYAGESLCRLFYGHDPEYYHGPGLNEKEIYLPELSLLEDLTGNGIALGVLSGRIPSEANHALNRMEFDQLLAAGFSVFDDGTLPGKPEPDGLRLLEKRMGFERCVYVGDTPDDW